MHWQWPNISLCQENKAGLSWPIAISNDGLMDMSCQWTPRLRRRAPARGHRKKIAQNGASPTLPSTDISKYRDYD